jgi:hypothetical protein
MLRFIGEFKMTTNNRHSMLFWIRSFLTLCLIVLVLPIGSVSAQDETPGSGKQQPVIPSQAEPNSAEPLDAANVIQDSSFEASAGTQAFWTQSSTNFTTPLCPSTAPAPAGCGDGSGTAGPHSGSAWVWFGGVNFSLPGFVSPEVATMSQTVAFPTSCNVTLQFYLWVGYAQKGSGADDIFAVSVDGGAPIFQVNATQKAFYPSYRLVSLSLKAYADGNPHTINFVSVTSGQLVTFNVDDVTMSITNCTCGAINQYAAASPANAPLTAGESFTAGPLGNAPGSDTTGVFRPSNGVIFLKNSNTTGFADIALNYGVPSDCPIVGDWDGSGTDTIGIYRNGVFYLRNSNTVGFADLVFAFGTQGDQPLAGDWNGDGVDTIGVYRTTNGQFLLRNSNTAGPPDITFFLGNVGDVGIAGDWNGDGTDTTGVFRPVNGIIFLKNTNTSGFADIALNYGIPGDKPLTGDWDNNGTDTIGVYRNNTYYLRNSNTVGFADIVFGLGNPGDIPIAGNWDGLP